MALPAMSWKTPAKGPSACDRKPLVGDPPFNQDRADAVSWPSPNSLSRNAHMKIQPSEIRAAAQTYWTTGLWPARGAGVRPFWTIGTCVATMSRLLEGFSLCTKTRARAAAAAGPEDCDGRDQWP